PARFVRRFTAFDFSRFFARFVKLYERFDNLCSRFRLPDGHLSQPALIDRPSIPLDLAQAGMTSNCRDLVRSAPCLGEAARSRLAEAMRAAMMKVRHIALATKPIRESDARERLPEFCHQKRHIPGGGAIDSRTQLTANRNQQLDSSFLLSDIEGVTADVLATHPDDVRAPLSRMQQERQGESCARTNRMTCLELHDLGLTPGMVAA